MEKISDLQELKQRIDIVKYIGSFVELTEKNGEYWGHSPFNANDINPSFSITPSNQLWYCYSTSQGGDIIDFIQLYNRVSFHDAIQIASKAAGVSVEFDNSFPILAELKRCRKVVPTKKEREGVILEPGYMDMYQRRKITEWTSEFISPAIADEFGVRYDPSANALVMPVHDLKENLINVKGRRLDPNYKEKRLSKYFHVFGMPSPIDFLWGYGKNLENTKAANELILVEAEKSVMQCAGYGYRNVMAISTSHLTIDQVKTIIKLRVPVIVALDSDKLPTVKNDCNFRLLAGATDCWTLIDTNGMLPDKASPSDCGKEIFEHLLENRIRL